MSTVIGIDFGTTNSLCAWLTGTGLRSSPTLEARARRQRVACTAKGETLVGESAKNQAYINPENTISGVKRLLGSEGLLSMGGKLEARGDSRPRALLLKAGRRAPLGCPSRGP